MDPSYFLPVALVTFGNTPFLFLGLFLNALSSFCGALGDIMIRKAFLNLELECANRCRILQEETESGKKGSQQNSRISSRTSSRTSRSCSCSIKEDIGPTTTHSPQLPPLAYDTSSTSSNHKNLTSCSCCCSSSSGFSLSLPLPTSIILGSENPTTTTSTTTTSSFTFPSSTSPTTPKDFFPSQAADNQAADPHGGGSETIFFSFSSPQYCVSLGDSSTMVVRAPPASSSASSLSSSILLTPPLATSSLYGTDTTSRTSSNNIHVFSTTTSRIHPPQNNNPPAAASPHHQFSFSYCYHVLTAMVNRYSVPSYWRTFLSRPFGSSESSTRRPLLVNKGRPEEEKAKKEQVYADPEAGHYDHNVLPFSYDHSSTNDTALSPISSLTDPSPVSTSFSNFHPFDVPTLCTDSLPPILSVYRQPLWLGGITITAVIGPLFNLLAIEFLPASIVGFAGLQIVFVMILARFYLNEIMTFTSYLGAALVIIGLLLVMLSAGRDPTFGSVVQFCAYFYSIQAVLFFAITGGILTFGVCYFTDRVVQWVATIQYCCGICQHCFRIQRIMLPATAGLFGAVAGLAAKAMLISVTTVFTHTPVTFIYVSQQWRALVIIACTIVFALLELLFLNRSLQKYDAIQVVPIVNSVITVGSAVGGILLFEELPKHPIFWSLGLVIVVTGVLCVSYARSIAEKSSQTTGTHPTRNTSSSSRREVGEHTQICEQEQEHGKERKNGDEEERQRGSRSIYFHVC